MCIFHGMDTDFIIQFLWIWVGFYLTNFLYNEVFKCKDETPLNGSFTVYIKISVY